MFIEECRDGSVFYQAADKKMFHMRRGRDKETIRAEIGLKSGQKHV